MKTKIVKFEKGVDEAVRVLKNGEVIACATDTVYGLSSDPFNKSAVKKIYDLKNSELMNTVTGEIIPLNEPLTTSGIYSLKLSPFITFLIDG